MNEIEHRIRAVREAFCDGNNKKFAEILGKSVQYASDISRGRSVGKKVLENILSKFPQISRSWLYAGEGEMLRSDASTMVKIEGDIHAQGDSYTGTFTAPININNGKSNPQRPCTPPTDSSLYWKKRYEEMLTSYNTSQQLLTSMQGKYIALQERYEALTDKYLKLIERDLHG